MGWRPDPISSQDWHAHYHVADERRRRAGWHRRGPSKPRRRLGATGVLAIGMGLAAVAVIVCLALPA